MFIALLPVTYYSTYLSLRMDFEAFEGREYEILHRTYGGIWCYTIYYIVKYTSSLG